MRRLLIRFPVRFKGVAKFFLAIFLSTPCALTRVLHEELGADMVAVDFAVAFVTDIFFIFMFQSC